MVSDTHTTTPHLSANHNKAYRHPLPKSDIFIHAGDLTKLGYLPEHQTIVDMLKRDVDAELKIVIAGNHDLSHDREFVARHGLSSQAAMRLEDPDDVRTLYTNQEAQDAGIVYMEEEVKTFTLKNGAKVTIYASPYTPAFGDWAFAYERYEDRFNPSTPITSSKVSTFVPDFPSVDIMVTHGPPRGILDQVVYTRENVGCDNLLKACRRARPRLHVFGHIHEGFGAVRGSWNDKKDNNDNDDSDDDWLTNKIEQDPETVLENRFCYYDLSSDADEPLRFGEETLFVNASVVTVGYRADNAPWVVDLDLPLAAATSY